MARCFSLFAWAVVPTLLLTLLAGTGWIEERAGATEALVEDKVVAGGVGDFMEARRVVLRGTNEEIGRALASIAKRRFGVKPAASGDTLRTRAQRRFVEKNYPILFERMRGVAAELGGRIDDNSMNFSRLTYPGAFRPGCSVVYLPPGLTASKTGIVSRNFDFSTGSLRGTYPKEGELPATCRPYVIEMHPDRGYASISIHSYDLLSGVTDGLNSEGLTVALLADDELVSKFPMEPADVETAGLGVLQMQRFLLDTCANVEEAKEALLATKQYYEAIPVHYLVADRHGKSFVWEYSQAHNKEYVIENPNKALITTNFSLHRYLERKAPPSAERAKTVCKRYCTLYETIARHSGKLTLDVIKEAHKQVDAVQPPPKGSLKAPGRTLWHALYVPEDRSLEVSFYLRDEPILGDPAQHASYDPSICNSG